MKNFSHSLIFLVFALGVEGLSSAKGDHGVAIRCTAKEQQAIDQWFVGVAARDPWACYQVGKLLIEKGQRSRIDFEKALDYLTQAGDANVTEAQLYLGDLYGKGFFLGESILWPNQHKAHCWYDKAAQQGSKRAQRYLEAKKSAVPNKEALQEGENPTDPKQQYRLAKYFLKQENNRVKAIEHFKNATLYNHEKAEIWLARLDATEEEAVKRLKRLSTTSSSAAYELAKMQGDLDAMEKLAKAGDKKAQKYYGIEKAQAFFKEHIYSIGMPSSKSVAELEAIAEHYLDKDDEEAALWLSVAHFLAPLNPKTALVQELDPQKDPTSAEEVAPFLQELKAKRDALDSQNEIEVIYVAKNTLEEGLGAYSPKLLEAFQQLQKFPESMYAQITLGAAYMLCEKTQQKGLEILENIAKTKNTRIYALLGSLCEDFGDQNPKLHEKFLEYYHKGAEKKDVACIINLGRYYANFYRQNSAAPEAEENRQKAIALLKEVTEVTDHPKAYRVLSKLYAQKKTPESRSLAIEMAKKAIELGSVEGLYILRPLVLYQNVPTKERISIFEAICQQGEGRIKADAAKSLGDIYAGVLGGDAKNEKKARQYYKKALDMYEKLAQEGDGDAYFQGGQIWADELINQPQKAAEWYKAALRHMDANYPLVLSALGALYIEQLSDAPQGLAYYEQSGAGDLLVKAGEYYSTGGNGIPKDLQKAVALIEQGIQMMEENDKEAYQHHFLPQAYKILGGVYSQKGDYAKACEAYQQIEPYSFEYIKAQVALAEIYWQEEGRDLKKVWHYLALALKDTQNIHRSDNSGSLPLTIKLLQQPDIEASLVEEIYQTFARRASLYEIKYLITVHTGLLDHEHRWLSDKDEEIQVTSHERIIKFLETAAERKEIEKFALLKLSEIFGQGPDSVKDLQKSTHYRSLLLDIYKKQIEEKNVDEQTYSEVCDLMRHKPGSSQTNVQDLLKLVHDMFEACPEGSDTRLFLAAELANIYASGMVMNHEIGIDMPRARSYLQQALAHEENKAKQATPAERVLVYQRLGNYWDKVFPVLRDQGKEKSYYQSAYEAAKECQAKDLDYDHDAYIDVMDKLFQLSKGEEAILWGERIAEAGRLTIYLNLGELCCLGKNVEKNIRKGMTYYKKFIRSQEMDQEQLKKQSQSGAILKDSAQTNLLYTAYERLGEALLSLPDKTSQDIHEALEVYGKIHSDYYNYGQVKLKLAQIFLKEKEYINFQKSWDHLRFCFSKEMLKLAYFPIDEAKKYAAELLKEIGNNPQLPAPDFKEVHRTVLQSASQSPHDINKLYELISIHFPDAENSENIRIQMKLHLAELASDLCKALPKGQDFAEKYINDAAGYYLEKSDPETKRSPAAMEIYKKVAALYEKRLLEEGDNMIHHQPAIFMGIIEVLKKPYIINSYQELYALYKAQEDIAQVDIARKLSRIYDQGGLVEKNKEKALEYLHQALQFCTQKLNKAYNKQNNADIIKYSEKAGDFLYESLEEKGRVDARTYYKTLLKLADNNHKAAAKRKLGNCYLYAAEADRKIDKGIRYYEEAAEEGDNLGAHHFGLWNCTGNLVPQNVRKGIKYLKQVKSQILAQEDPQLNTSLFFADLGDAFSQHLDPAERTPADLKAAIEAYQRVTSDDPKAYYAAQLSLAKIYLSEEGFVDLGKAWSCIKGFIRRDDSKICKDKELLAAGLIYEMKKQSLGQIKSNIKEVHRVIIDSGNSDLLQKVGEAYRNGQDMQGFLDLYETAFVEMKSFFYDDQKNALKEKYIDSIVETYLGGGHGIDPNSSKAYKRYQDLIDQYDYYRMTIMNRGSTGGMKPANIEKAFYKLYERYHGDSQSLDLANRLVKLHLEQALGVKTIDEILSCYKPMVKYHKAKAGNEKERLEHYIKIGQIFHQAPTIITTQTITLQKALKYYIKAVKNKLKDYTKAMKKANPNDREAPDLDELNPIVFDAVEHIISVYRNDLNDFAQSFNWQQRAIEAGHMKSLVELGTWLCTGQKATEMTILQRVGKSIPEGQQMIRQALNRMKQLEAKGIAVDPMLRGNAYHILGQTEDGTLRDHVPEGEEWPVYMKEACQSYEEALKAYRQGYEQRKAEHKKVFLNLDQPLAAQGQHYRTQVYMSSLNLANLYATNPECKNLEKAWEHLIIALQEEAHKLKDNVVDGIGAGAEGHNAYNLFLRMKEDPQAVAALNIHVYTEEDDMQILQKGENRSVPQGGGSEKHITKPLELERIMLKNFSFKVTNPNNEAEQHITRARQRMNQTLFEEPDNPGNPLVNPGNPLVDLED